MESRYQILPKRTNKTDGFFKSNQSQFLTNYFDIAIESKNSKIYQYVFALPQEVPMDSNLYEKSIASVKKQLRSKISYICHSKQIIWGYQKLKVATALGCSFQNEHNKFKFEATLKLTKQIDLRDLQKQEYKPIYMQILAVHLKNVLKQLKLSEQGKSGKYFEKDFCTSDDLFDRGINVLKGFKFSFADLCNSICVQIDVCTRVLQAKNLLQTFNGKQANYNKQKYQGATVIANYGTFKTYRIEQIDYYKTPTQKFFYDKTGQEINYLQYFKETYGLNIRNNKQPLVKAIKSVRKQLIKGGKQIKEIVQTVYLVPQLVSLTGMQDQQRADHSTMKLLAPYTKLQPSQRMTQYRKIITQINSTDSILKILSPRLLQGYYLPYPNIIYSGAKIQPDNRGTIKYRGLLKESAMFKDWVFAYSVNKNTAARDDEDADLAVRLIKEAGQVYGVQFKEPGFVCVQAGNVSNWLDQLENDTKKNGLPQIVVVFLSPFQEKIYPQLKRYITNEMKVPSQFIRKRTLINQKGAMSSASKIVIQMNTKIGSVPWEIQKRHKYFQGKKMMYGAISISKGLKGYTLAFVGTINSQCTKIFSSFKNGLKDKQSIPVEILQQIFIEWAKGFYQANNKKSPDLIILYREGLSVPQIKMQVPKMQLPALQGMIKKIGQKTKNPTYNPELLLVLASKKISTRIFTPTSPISNPESGTVLIHSLSTSPQFTFHLVPQFVNQGTCTPTLYRIGLDTSQITEQALINFTYEQCFGYYNWEGAVRVPACLQYAEKLGKMGAILGDTGSSSMSKKMYFL